jgi:hypothetical protein
MNKQIAGEWFGGARMRSMQLLRRSLVTAAYSLARVSGRATLMRGQIELEDGRGELGG